MDGDSNSLLMQAQPNGSMSNGNNATAVPTASPPPAPDATFGVADAVDIGDEDDSLASSLADLLCSDDDEDAEVIDAVNPDAAAAVFIASQRSQNSDLSLASIPGMTQLPGQQINAAVGATKPPVVGGALAKILGQVREECDDESDDDGRPAAPPARRPAPSDPLALQPGRSGGAGGGGSVQAPQGGPIQQPHVHQMIDEDSNDAVQLIDTSAMSGGLVGTSSATIAASAAVPMSQVALLPAEVDDVGLAIHGRNSASNLDMSTQLRAGIQTPASGTGGVAVGGGAAGQQAPLREVDGANFATTSSERRHIFQQHWLTQDSAVREFLAAQSTIESFDAPTTAAEIRKQELMKLRFMRLVNECSWGDGSVKSTDVYLPAALVGQRASHHAAVAKPTKKSAKSADQSSSTESGGSRSPTLRHHQVHGIRWLWRRLAEAPLSRVRTAGAILSHSMGLGKTCQVLSFSALLAKHKVPGARVLLLTPKSTLSSWEGEHGKWMSFFVDSADGLSVDPLARARADAQTGDASFATAGGAQGQGTSPLGMTVITDATTKAQRQRLLMQWADPPRQVPAGTPGHIIAVSYESFVSMCNTWLDPREVTVDLVVCDEGHRLKTTTRRDSRAVMSLNASRRLVLTGTPLQNHLLEYWSMIECVMPRYFERNTFRKFFARPIAESMTAKADQRKVEIGRQRTFTLLQQVEPFVNRRDMSVLVSELPKLTETVVVVKVSPIQKLVYAKLIKFFLSKGKNVNILQAYAYTTKLCAHPQLLFNAGQRLQQVDPAAFDASALDAALDVDIAAAAEAEAVLEDDDAKERRKMSRRVSSTTNLVASTPAGAGNASSPTGNKQPTQLIGARDASTSTADQRRLLIEACTPPAEYQPRSDDSHKFAAALALIRRFSALNEKVLLFSSSTMMLNFFQEALVRAGQEFNEPKLGTYCRIDGSVSGEDRKAQIQRFETDPNVACFLISTRAGGMGLTLTAASRVIILDCSWNPADDRQAIGRAYRYGQTKPVFVYRLVCQDTMEHRIFDQKVAKEWLFSTVVDSEVLKRDHLRGTKLQHILLTSEQIKVHPQEQQRRKIETDRSAVNDAALSLVRDLIDHAFEQNTMIEQDEAYGQRERAFYDQFIKHGGLAAEQSITQVGVAAVSKEKTAEETAAAASEVNRQGKTLATVLGKMVADRRAKLAQQSRAAPTPASQATAAILARLGVDPTALELPAAAGPMRVEYRRRGQVTGAGATRDVALNVDSDEDSADTADAPKLNPRQALAAAANEAEVAAAATTAPAVIGGGKSEDPFVIDSDDE